MGESVELRHCLAVLVESDCLAGQANHATATGSVLRCTRHPEGGGPSSTLRGDSSRGPDLPAIRERLVTDAGERFAAESHAGRSIPDAGESESQRPSIRVDHVADRGGRITNHVQPESHRARLWISTFGFGPAVFLAITPRGRRSERERRGSLSDLAGQFDDHRPSPELPRPACRQRRGSGPGQLPDNDSRNGRAFCRSKSWSEGITLVATAVFRQNK